jgi:hypothetical protein
MHWHSWWGQQQAQQQQQQQQMRTKGRRMADLHSMNEQLPAVDLTCLLPLMWVLALVWLIALGCARGIMMTCCGQWLQPGPLARSKTLG